MPLRIVQGNTIVTGSADNSSEQSGVMLGQLCTASLTGASVSAYAWTLTPALGAPDALSSTTAAAPTFTPTKGGIYLLVLNGTYTLPFLVTTTEPNVYQGPVVPAYLTPQQAPVPASGTSIISDSTKVGSLLSTDINGLQAPIAIVRAGLTAARPTSPAVGLYVGFIFFDTTLAKPIWWTGAGWVDATGASV